MSCEIAPCHYHQIDKSILVFNTPTNPPNHSLVIASLELGRMLADRGKITFRAYGTCMFPCIRPGDVLHIESRTIDRVAVSDIAVCRTPGFLYGHRVIHKGINDGRPYIVTRPDNAREGGDAPIFDENLLGVIVAIERKGRLVPLPLMKYPCLIRCYFSACLGLFETTRRTRTYLIRTLTKTLAFFQNRVMYRSIASWVFWLNRPRVSYGVRISMNKGLADAVFRQLKLDEFDVRTTWQERAIERWTLVMYINNARQPAAWVTFVCRENTTWYTEESNFRLRYRGLGLDDVIIAKAKTILNRSGMKLLRTNL